MKYMRKNMRRSCCGKTMRKTCPYSELFWSAFSCIWTECREIRSISPYSVRMRENADSFHAALLYILDSNAFMKRPSINSTRDYILYIELYIEFKLEIKNMQNYIYDAQFRRNVLIVGKTGCRKTHFVQKLGLNNFFVKILKTELILEFNFVLTTK